MAHAIDPLIIKNPYNVGDIIINKEGTKFFVARTADRLHYTIIDRKQNMKRLVLNKFFVHSNTELCLSSKLKKL